MPPVIQVPVSLPAPDQPYCLWHVDKRAEGERQLQQRGSTKCQIGVGNWGRIRLWDLSLNTRTPDGCNEETVIPEGSILRSHDGWYVRRTHDGLTVYTSPLQILDPSGGQLFDGQMGLSEKVGTHQPPLVSEDCQEACDQHIEGWLVAHGVGKLDGYLLHLAIAGHGSDPNVATELIYLHLNGALLQYTP
jgi:hypothetical protein